MQIAQAVVMDILSVYKVTPMLSAGSHFSFRSAQLLSADSDPLDPATLYIGTTAQFKQLRSAALHNVCILCIGKQEYFEKYCQRHAANLLLLPEDVDLFSVANRVFAAFSRLQRWELELDKAILAQKSYQDVVELGAQVFGENPVLLTTASYNVLASSIRSTPYNEKVSAVLERGYYSKEDADAFLRMGYLSHLERYMTVERVDPPNYMGCTFFLLSFDAGNGTSVGFVTVYFVKDTPTEGLFELFRVFAERINKYYKRQLQRDISIPTPLEMFMTDLIEHTREDQGYLIDRAKALKLPLDKPYRLGVVRWEEYNPTVAHYIIGRLRANLHFPYLKILRYRQSVLLMMQGSMPSLKVIENVNQAFHEFSSLLKDCKGYVGFSSISNSLLKMDVAYQQACAAEKYGKMLAPEQRIHFYSRFYIYEMLDLYSQRYQLEDMYIQKLRLLQNPEAGDYSNLHLLRIYLLTERSLSATAKLLYMHRNSVIYRLGKIQNTLGVDLDDPDVRLRLLISFKILEMLDGHMQPPLRLENADDEASPAVE